MTQDVDSFVTAGNEALAAAEWTRARDSFHAALEVRRTAKALIGMGEALWWLGKLDESIGFREQGYAALRREPDPSQAALTALLLCMDYWKHMGNRAAAAGWLARASRLVEDFALEETRGWLLIVGSETLVDPESGEQEARRALELARRTGDIDLELCALSQIGALLVRQSKVTEGVAYLDESMAGCLSGEGGNPDTVVLCSCNMITSCTRSAEFERVVEWVRAADRFAKRYGCPFLYAECRTYYGGTLVATGDWRQAEVELTAAIEISRSSVPEYHRQALSSLAELRLAQGRIEEAERLVGGLEDHAVAAPRAGAHPPAARPARCGRGGGPARPPGAGVRRGTAGERAAAGATR